jgi:hypothetical protein
MRDERDERAITIYTESTTILIIITERALLVLIMRRRRRGRGRRDGRRCGK